MISEVKTHNDQFSIGAMMAKAMLNEVEVAGKAYDLEQEGLPLEEAHETARWLHDQKPMSEEQETDRFFLGAATLGTLEKSGLTLSPVRKGVTMFGPGGEDSVGVVRLQIADGGKFIGFLQAVPETAVDDDFRKSVETVAQHVTAEAYQELDEGNDNPIVAETLVYAPAINKALVQIGAKPSKLLAQLAEYNSEGLVHEFIAADKSGLLREPASKTFSPSEWQHDATAEFLSDRWGSVTDAIQAAKNNPNGADFAKVLLHRAEVHLDHARRDWQDMKHTNADKGYGQDYGKGFDGVFENVSKKLAKLAE